VRRRAFIALLGGAAAAWPLAAHAQQQPGQMRRIGVFMSTAENDVESKARVAAFLQGLQQLGWIDGRNVRIDIRWPAGDTERIRRYAAEFATLAPDVILATGATVPSLLQATRDVPIVFTIFSDPVGAGLVDSLARPGGNVTGFTVFEYSLSGKWLELLKQIAPHVMRAAVVRDSSGPSGIGQFGAIQTAAPSLGIEVSPVSVRDADEIERAVAAFSRSSNGGLIVTGSALAVVHRDLIITLACRYKLPAVYFQRLFHRPVPARGQLRRSHPQGREACRHARTGTDQVRNGHQPQDCQGAWAECAGQAARDRRRGDRIGRLFAAIAHSRLWHEATDPECLLSGLLSGGKADSI
jgi:putative ABC transport system substrate-binding protein